MNSILAFLKESVFSDEYAAKKGFLQAVEPRIKFLCFLFLLLAVLFFRNIYFLLALYGFCLFLARLSVIPLGFFLKRTWVFIPLFSLFIALPAVFTQGILSASFFFTRVLTSVSFCVLLVLTTRHYMLLKVLRVFGVPQVFVMVLGMCYRYIYLFIEIIQNTYLAIKSRVGRISAVKHGQKIAVWNIACLWQRSYQLSEEVYKAMLSRGYRGEAKTYE